MMIKGDQMFGLLLVACAGVDDSGGETPLDVEVWPLSFSATYEWDEVFDPEYRWASVLHEKLGTVNVLNHEPAPVTVEVDSTSEDPILTYTTYDGPSWLDVTLFRDASVTLNGSTDARNQTVFDVFVYAYFLPPNGIERGTYPFTLEVLINDRSYPIEAVITLE